MSIDLRYRLGLARDQGPRETCLSFALSDAHRAGRAHPSDFSPECLHKKAADAANQDPMSPLTPTQATEALASHGQTEESAWLYNDVSQTIPGASLYTAKSAIWHFDQTLLNASLLADVPIVLGINIGQEFFDGNIPPVLTQLVQPVEGCHAILVVGMRAASNDNEYLIRNSWGAGWGDSGHAWLSKSYLQSNTVVCISLGAFS